MTTILLILVLVLVLALPLVIKDNAALVRQARVGLVIVAALLLLARWIGAPPTPLDGVELSDNRNWAVGWKFGQALAEQFPDGGELIVLVNNEDREAIVAMTAAQLEGLETGCRKAGFDLQVFRPAGNERAAFSHVPDAKEIRRQVEQSPDAVAIVSFVRFPFAGLKTETLPTVYLWDQYGSGYWKGWMKAGAVAAAAYPVQDFARRSNAQLQHGSPEERFSSVYDLVTPATLSQDRRP